MSYALLPALGKFKVLYTLMSPGSLVIPFQIHTKGTNHGNSSSQNKLNFKANIYFLQERD